MQQLPFLRSEHPSAPLLPTLLPQVLMMPDSHPPVQLQARKRKDLYLWMAKIGSGPSVKFHVKNSKHAIASHSPGWLYPWSLQDTPRHTVPYRQDSALPCLPGFLRQGIAQFTPWTS